MIICGIGLLVVIQITQYLFIVLSLA